MKQPIKMNQTEFAKEIGKSKGYVSQLKEAGRLVFDENNRVDVEASKIRLEETADPNRDDVKARHAADKKEKPPGKVLSLDEIKFSTGRAKEQHFKALTAEVEYNEKIGSYVKKSDMQEAVADLVTTFRQSLENMPHRLSPELVGKDANFIRLTIKQAVHDVLAELQKNCDKMIKESAP